jgi:hypothetical protein
MSWTEALGRERRAARFSLWRTRLEFSAEMVALTRVEDFRNVDTPVVLLVVSLLSNAVGRMGCVRVGTLGIS